MITIIILLLNIAFIVFILFVFFDRRKAMIKLQKSKLQLSEAQRLAHIGSWEWDMLTNHITWSDELYRIFGQDPASFKASYEDFLALIHPEDRAFIDGIVKQATQDYKPFNFFHRVRRPDGSESILNGRGSVMLDKKDNPIRMIGTAQDVTLIKRAERILHESNERNRLVLDTALDAFVSIDRTGRVTEWNKQAELMFGWNRQEAMGQAMADMIIPERYRKDHFSGLARFLSTGEGPVLNKRVSLSALRRNGSEFPVELAIRPLKLGDEYSFHAFIHDITDRKLAEDKIRVARDTLETQVKERTLELYKVNEELQRVNERRVAFTSIVSHELRTPLSAIKAGIDMVIEGVEGSINEGQREILSISKSNVDRLTRLINDVLDYARLEAGKMEITCRPVNLNLLLEEVFLLMKRETDKRNIVFALKVSDTPIELACDADKIKAIVINLIHNAIKFTQAKGTIQLCSSIPEPGCAAISVQDTGVGISKEEQENIFELFQQGSGAPLWMKGGSGIGLATCKLLTELHRGTISVKSEVGKGTRFIVTLPLQQP